MRSEFTPVEIPPTGYQNYEGISRVSLNQEEDPKLQLRSSSHRWG
ncbi:hypothetical protein [Thermoplasma acidophilum]|nr:hypothetical protein [Thermoplasma acidophilum]MCY0851397.1 hypothetical protein [Thermoplasma acidophilum]